MKCTIIGEGHLKPRHQVMREHIQKLFGSYPIMPIFVEGIMRGEESSFGYKSGMLFGIEDSNYKLFSGLCMNYAYLSSGNSDLISHVNPAVYSYWKKCKSISPNYISHLENVIDNHTDKSLLKEIIEKLLPDFRNPQSVKDLLENPKDQSIQKIFMADINFGTREDYWLDILIKNLPQQDFIVWCGAGHLDSFRNKIVNSYKLNNIEVNCITLEDF